MRFLRNGMLAALLLFAAAGGCDESTVGGINVGSIDSGFTAATLIAASDGACNAYGCDGVLDTGGIFRGSTDGDPAALFGMIFWNPWGYGINSGDIAGSEIYGDVIGAIDEESDGVVKTFTATSTMPCSDESGSIQQTFLWRTTFDSGGSVEGSDALRVLTTRFVNCLIQGDLLHQKSTESVRLNGSWSMLWDYPGEPSEATPEIFSVNGRVTLQTDDAPPAATRGDPFWTPAVNFDATEIDDGSETTHNGGACAGQATLFGTGEGASETDADDDCAPDTDGKADVFVATDDLLEL